MNKRDFMAAANQMMEPFMRKHGFSRRQNLEYQRRINDVNQRIILVPKLEKGTGRIGMTSGGCGIKVPVVEGIVSQDEDFDTVGMPVHLLQPGKQYHEWIFVTSMDILRFVPQILLEIQEYGLPFLNCFSNVESVHSALKSENSDNWFMCSEGSRDSLLVAFEYAIRGREAALKMAEGLMAKYADKLPKYSNQLRNVMTRIQLAGK